VVKDFEDFFPRGTGEGIITVGGSIGDDGSKLKTGKGRGTETALCEAAESRDRS